MADDTTHSWRTYAAWGSFICGLTAAFLTLVFMIHLDLVGSSLHDRWEAGYLFSAGPISLLGVICGIAGEEAPRRAGLILSGGILLWVLGGAIST
jgi:hypothetical protein